MAEDVDFVDLHSIYVPVQDSADRWASWKQPFTDLGLPAASEPSDWLRQVAHHRVLVYDRIRQFLSRLALIVVVCGGLFALAPRVQWWAVVLVIPAILQVTLEIALEKPIRREVMRVAREAAETGHTRAEVLKDLEDELPWPLRVWLSVYLVLPFNVTGVLGGVAAPCLLIGVVYGTSATADNGWVKVATFAAALLYLNSAASGPLLEGTVYERSRAGEILRRVRPFAWPALCLFSIVALVLPAHLIGLWPVPSLPYAYMVCALPYALGLRIREHDRAINASGLLIKSINDERRRSMKSELHNIVSHVFKGLSEKVLGLPGLDELERSRLDMFFEDLKVAHENSRGGGGLDVRTPLLPTVEASVVRRARRFGLDAEINVRIEREARHEKGSAEAKLAYEGARLLVKEILVALIDNAGQAYKANSDLDVWPATVSADREEGEIVLRVSDALGPVPDDKWLKEGILETLSSDIRKRGGSFMQYPDEGGGKTIEVRWPADEVDLMIMRMKGMADDEDLGDR